MTEQRLMEADLMTGFYESFGCWQPELANGTSAWITELASCQECGGLPAWFHLGGLPSEPLSPLVQKESQNK